MNVITTLDEIKDNLSLFENYLCEGIEEEQKFAYSLIQKGKSFIAYKVEGELRFSPSRYIGYSRNTMSKHNNNIDKDGKETNPAISKVIDDDLDFNSKLEAEYLRFIEKFGIKPHNKKRKYWLLDIEGADFFNNVSSIDGFPEGKIVERNHKARERSSKLISIVKEKFLKENGSLYCMACNFDFEKTYGERGEGYIEAHHTIPVSEMESGQKTNTNDIVLVCSNCHRILHRARPWLTISNLKKLLTKT